jgi:hypothetical protein
VNKRRSYHEVLKSWDGLDPTPELYDALGRIALGDLAFGMIGAMFFVPIGRRVFQLLEIAIEEGSREEQGA